MDTLTTLISHPGAPHLIYLHHPHNPPSTLRPAFPQRCTVARVDTVEHNTARLFYAGVLSRLGAVLRDTDGGDTGDPGDTGNSADGPDTDREILSWDAFVRGLRKLWDSHARKGKGKGKGKGKEMDLGRVSGQNGIGADGDEDEGQVVLFITKAERLSGVLGASWTALMRLGELANVPATVILASQVSWDSVRSLRADAPEPIHVYVEPLARDAMLAQLLQGSSHPLYPRFLDLLLSSISHLVPSSTPSEIDYVASALWPIYTSSLPPHAEMTLLGKTYPDPESPPPPLPVTLSLLTDLKHQLSLSLAASSESLLPRTVGRSEFTRALLPFTSTGEPRPPSSRQIPRPPNLASRLPLAAKYLLIAAYCASYNPAKSDIRIFGRGTGPDGKRRRGGGVRRAGYGRVRVGKVSQRLLGPRAVPLDRLLACFASLYAEHAPRPEDSRAGQDSDSDSDPELPMVGDTTGPRPSYLTNPEAIVARSDRKRTRDLARRLAWDDTVDHLTHSARLWALIPHLEAAGLLRRSSPPDRLDSVLIRCEVGYELVKEVAREVGVVLDEYLYEAVV